MTGRPSRRVRRHLPKATRPNQTGWIGTTGDKRPGCWDSIWACMAIAAVALFIAACVSLAGILTATIPDPEPTRETTVTGTTTP